MSGEHENFDDFGEEEAGLGLPAQLRDPIRVLKRQYRWILVSLAIFVAAAAAATMSFPLRYAARATIILTEKSIPDNYVPTTIIANIQEQFDAIRGVVFSRAGLSKIVTETNLYPNEREVLPITQLAGRLASELSVETLPSKGGGRGAPHSLSFAVKMAGKDPKTLARVVNTTVSELIDANVEYRSRQARVTTQFMQREFDRADEALRSHQRELAAFRGEHRGGALPEEQNASLSKLERLEDQRRSSILQVSDLRARLERIEARPNSAGGSGDLEELAASLQRAKAIYTDDHPTVRSLERRLEEMQSDSPSGGTGASLAHQEERSIIKRAISLEQARLAQIDEDVLALETRLATAPEIVEEYSAMVREETILQENYVEFLRKLKSAELALSLEHSQQGAQLTRLDTALPPSSPIMPRWMVGAAGGVVSVVLALLVGAVRELLFPVIIDVQHLEDAIPIPCLGSITEIV